MGNLIYQGQHKIRSFDIDFNKDFKLFSIVNLIQEVAFNHAHDLNFGVSDLNQNNLTWVLSRMKINIHRNAKQGEVITARTWPKGFKGMFAMRDIEVLDENGKAIIEATTAWLIVDQKTKKLCRTNPYQSLNFDIDKYVIEEVPDKIKTPENVNLNHERKILLSDIDLNQHTNNTKYIEMIINCFTIKHFEEHRIKSFQINYLAEAIINDNIEVFTNFNDINNCIVEGRVANKKIFNSTIEFEKY
jgi:acyl-ACP thioesterase